MPEFRSIFHYQADASVGARDQGVVIPLHWFTPFLEERFPAEVFSSLDQAQAVFEAAQCEDREFPFLDL